jgi:hypothetical protein
VRGAIPHLTAEPTKQTFHILDPLGASAGWRLTLHGNNDIRRLLPCGRLNHCHRARHGIQNDSTVAVHVTTKYDAEVGRLGADLDITGLRRAMRRRSRTSSA